jgi:hypothetical protein
MDHGEKPLPVTRGVLYVLLFHAHLSERAQEFNPKPHICTEADS